MIGSVGCALSESMSAVVFWRVFQAVGACVGPMLSRAMIRDRFAQSQAAQTLSTLTIIMAIAPIAGPFIGGGLLKGKLALDFLVISSDWRIDVYHHF